MANSWLLWLLWVSTYQPYKPLQLPKPELWLGQAPRCGKAWPSQSLGFTVVWLLVIWGGLSFLSSWWGLEGALALWLTEVHAELQLRRVCSKLVLFPKSTATVYIHINQYRYTKLSVNLAHILYLVPLHDNQFRSPILELSYEKFFVVVTVYSPTKASFTSSVLLCNWWDRSSSTAV